MLQTVSERNLETTCRDRTSTAIDAIDEIYQEKIPRIMFRIALCVLIGVIASIAHVFLIASSLGVNNAFLFAVSIPGALLFALIICLFTYEDETKFSSCLRVAVVMIASAEIILLSTRMFSYSNKWTFMLSVLCPSVVCITILISAIRQPSREKWMFKELSRPTMIFLFLAFSSIHCILAFPVSKLYNYRQIETAQMLVEKFEITQKEDHIEILLPGEYAKYNNYLKNTFSIGWLIDSLSGESLKTLWEKERIVCHKGKRKWYIVKIPFPEYDEGALLLHFKHPYEDYEARTEPFSFRSP